jgi:hypothetical protein
MKRKRAQVLPRQKRWSGCIDNKLWWWCVRSWDGMQMVHWGIRNASNGKLKHEQWFDGSKQIVYIESVIGIWEFAFLLSLHVLLYRKASYHFEIFSTLVYCRLSRYILWAPFLWFLISHCSYQYYMHLTPPVTQEQVLQQFIWDSICLHPSTECMDYLEPCLVSFGIYRASNHFWIHMCDNCVDEFQWPTAFDIRHHTHCSFYSNDKVSSQCTFSTNCLNIAVTPSLVFELKSLNTFDSIDAIFAAT